MFARRGAGGDKKIFVAGKIEINFGGAEFHNGGLGSYQNL